MSEDSSFPRPINGFVKIPRNIVKHELWRETNTNSFKVFIYLNLFMNYSDTNYYNITIRPGQIVVGRKEMAKQTNLTENKIRGALKVLERLNVIKVDSSNKRFSIVTMLSHQKEVEAKVKNELTEEQKKFRITKGAVVCDKSYQLLSDILKDLKDKYKLYPSEETAIKLIDKAINRAKELSMMDKVNKKTGQKEIYGYPYVLSYVKVAILRFLSKEDKL